MSQFSVAPAPTDNVGKNFSFSSDQMTMMNLFASASKSSSNGGMRMPSQGSFRSPKPTTNNPHHRSRTTNIRTTSRFDSNDPQSSLMVGQRIYGHQPLQLSANQQSPNKSDHQTTHIVKVTLSDSQISKQPSDVGLMHKNRNSHINHSSTMATPQSPSHLSNQHGEDGDFCPMKRQGSHDARAHGMSVTSALRSRAIAIHPSKTLHPADIEEQDAQESLAIYDQATWRMYNRILDHRRNQATIVPRTMVSTQPTSNMVISDNFQTLQTLQALNDPHSNNFIDGEDDNDGEIFQLDL